MRRGTSDLLILQRRAVSRWPKRGDLDKSLKMFFSRTSSRNVAI
jgi:hypothetical protein